MGLGQRGIAAILTMWMLSCTTTSAPPVINDLATFSERESCERVQIGEREVCVDFYEMPTANLFEMPCNAEEWTATPGIAPGTHVVMTGFDGQTAACGAGESALDASQEARRGARCCMSPRWFRPR